MFPRLLELVFEFNFSLNIFELVKHHTMRNHVCQNQTILQLNSKKTHIQLLCKYPFDIIIIMQLSP
jgi:hypothetical protein